MFKCKYKIKIILLTLMLASLTACQKNGSELSAYPFRFEAVSWAKDVGGPGIKTNEQMDHHIGLIHLGYEHFKGPMALNPIHLNQISDNDLKMAVNGGLERAQFQHWLSKQEWDEITSPHHINEWRWFLSGRRSSLGHDLGALIVARQALWKEAGKSGLPSPLVWTEEKEVPALSVDGFIMSNPAQMILTAGLVTLAKLSDPHSNYLSPTEQDAFLDRFANEGNHVGIGWAQDKSGVIRVSDLLEGGPAFESGLVVGDRLMGIVSENAQGVKTEWGAWGADLESLLAILKGESGTALLFRVLRDDQEHDIRVVRSAFIPSKDRVRLEDLSQGWFKLTIPVLYDDVKTSHTGNLGSSADHVKEALKTIPSGSHLILDLRRSHGGSLEEAIKVMGLLRGQESFIQTVSSQHTITIEGAGEQVWEGPLVVWVGPQTMSSAEILALGLYGAPEVKTIGWQTYGKGTIQRRISMDPASIRERRPSEFGEIWLTTAWVMKSGYYLQKEGVPLHVPLSNPLVEPWGERANPRALARLNDVSDMQFNTNSDLNEDLWMTATTPYEIETDQQEWLKISQHALGWKGP